jgi:hypothetical protein
MTLIMYDATYSAPHLPETKPQNRDAKQLVSDDIYVLAA